MTAWSLLVAGLGFLVGFICRELILRERFIVYEKRIDMYLQTWAKIADAYVALKQFARVALRSSIDPRFQDAHRRADDQRYEAFVALQKNRLILDEALYETCERLMGRMWTFIAIGSGEKESPGEQKARREHEEDIDELYGLTERQARAKVQGWTRRLELITDRGRHLLQRLRAWLRRS
jgi:hypothetical protein